MISPELISACSTEYNNVETMYEGGEIIIETLTRLSMIFKLEVLIDTERY